MRKTLHHLASCLRREYQAGGSILQQSSHGRIFRTNLGKSKCPLSRKPDDDSGVRFIFLKGFSGGPGMRHVGRYQDEVRCLILPDVIADKPPAAAIQRQRKLIFRMVVPFERYFRNAAIVDAKRTALRKRDALELRLHRGTLFGHLAITYCPNNINYWPIRIIQEFAQILEWFTRLLR